MDQKTTQRVVVVHLGEDVKQAEEVFKALASERRLEILRFLSTERSTSSSITQIAEAFEMPNSTAAMHVNILEKAGLVRTELEPANRGLQKVCFRMCDQIVVTMPHYEQIMRNSIDIDMPIGAYVDCRVVPTCGLAGLNDVLGNFDDPRSFYNPERLQAQLIWFRQGYLEYRFPNHLPLGATLEDLQLSFEACSEAPMHHDDWPSDITLWINGQEIGTWTSPADFGGQRGTLTPKSWESWNSQYGLLKIWRVTDQASFIDGGKVSGVTLSDLNISYGGFITVRIGIKSDAHNVGGMNLFGREFGNYPQDILMRMSYVPDPKGGVDYKTETIS